MKPTNDKEIEAIIDQAAHAAYAVLCQKLDPQRQHDLGGFYDQPEGNREFEQLKKVLRLEIQKACLLFEEIKI